MLRETHTAFSLPVEHAHHDTTDPHWPARVEWLWVNDFSPNEYHIWHAWPSTWHVETKLQKYQAPIFTAQTRNHWRKLKGRASMDCRIGVIEFYVSANNKK